MCAYMVAKKTAIVFKTSSAPEGKSNPGVSMRVTDLPSRVNSSESWIPASRDSEPVGSGGFEPLARLINWRQSGELLVTITPRIPRTVVFPLPVAPITLWQRLE